MNLRRSLFLVLFGILIAMVVLGHGGFLPDVRIMNPGMAGDAVKVYDLDQDGVSERYEVDGQQLIVSIDCQEIWRSPADWRVTGFALADVTNDGRDDLSVVLWKQGSFGCCKPIWLTGDDDDYSNHLFVYNLVKGRLVSVWCSSALDRQILELSVGDTDGDGRNELVVRERDGGLTCWRWESWGFYLVNG